MPYPLIPQDSSPICTALGYDELVMEPTLTPERAIKAQAILDRLEVIDTQLEQAIGDSMATQIDTVHLDFASQVALLKAEGSRKLRELATISSTRYQPMSVQFDKYLGSRKPSPNSVYSPL
jgi:hypothetical protein